MENIHMARNQQGHAATSNQLTRVQSNQNLPEHVPTVPVRDGAGGTIT